MTRNSTTATAAVTFLATCALVLAALLSAWIVPTVTHQATSMAVATSISASVAALTTHGSLKFNPNEFAGYYRDPNHPHCQRIIQVAGNIASLSGTDGNPGCPADGSGEPWTLEGKIIGNQILVDFSPKGGPANLKGTYDESNSDDATDKPGIQWPDGNKWIKLKPRDGTRTL